MSIIYSYPTSQPTVDDLLIGTDVNDENATKSFTVQSLVSLINAAAGSGTVTFVQIATDAFLTATGGPIRDTGTITVGFSATGTPSATTFLRGDNQWVVPTVSAGIGVYKENIEKTLDVSSFNFTGAGITNVSSSADGAVTVTIPGAISAIETINAGTGITASPTTGNVVITNTGVIGVVDGTGITTTNSNGIITINASPQSGTGLARVDAGAGLTLSAGTPTSDPTVAISYAGVGNFINAGIDAAGAASTDSILFQQTSSGDVKSTTFGEIQASTLELIDTSITNSISNVIQYDTPAPTAANLSPFTFPSLPNVRNVVTLTDLEYTNLTAKDGNTLYLTATTGVAQITKTLTSITATVNYAQGTAWQYNTSFDTVNATRVGAQGGSYAFDTRIQAINGYTFTSGPSYTNASGTLDADGVVYSSLTATMASPPVAGNCKFEINYDTGAISLPSGILASAYSITATGGSVVSGNILEGTCPYSVASMESGFAVQLTINDTAQYEFSVAPSYSYSPTSGTSTAATSPVPVTCAITATIVRKTITLTYTTTDINTGGGSITTDYSINNTTNSGSSTFTTNASPNVGTSTIQAPYGSTYSINSSLINLSSSTSTTGSSSLTNPITGTMTANSTITNNFTTVTSANSNIVSSLPPSVSVGSSVAGSYNTSYQYKEVGTSTWIDVPVGGNTQSYPIGTNVEFRLGATTTGSYFFSTIPTVTYYGVVTANNAVFATITVDGTSGGTQMPYTPTISFVTSPARFSLNIASTGGQNNPLQPNYACDQGSVASVIWTTADRSSTGLQVGDIAYASQTGSTPYSTNTLTWWKTIAAGGAYNFQIVNFNSSGAVNAVQGC